MARPDTRFTQRMLDAANCRHRYWIEYEKNFRLRENSRWFPPRLKDLLVELMFARDWAISDGRDAEGIEVLLNRMSKKWWTEIVNVHSPDHRMIEEMTAISADADKIIAHYSECQRIDLIQKPVSKGRKPVVRRIVEHKLPSFEKKKHGGPSKYTFASLIHRLIIEDGEYKLFVHHLTSSTDPDDVRLDVSRRLDVYGTVWNAEKLLKKKISSIVFDVVRVKPPAEPTLLKCKKCKGTGKVKADVDGVDAAVDCEKCGGDGIEGVSTKRCDTTVDIWTRKYHQYKARNSTPSYKAAAETLIGDLYDRGNTFSYRIEVPVQRENIEQWLCDTYEQIREIEAAKKRGTFPRSPSNCRNGHSVCPFIARCSNTQHERSGEMFFKVVDEEFPGIRSW